MTEWRAGDDVVSTQRRRVCGSCRLCRTGRETLCVGQEFLGDVGMNGGYAQFVIVEQDNLAAKPHDVSFAHACVVASAIGTELNALRDVARVGVGESVLVTGAGGGLGIHGIQVARALGARTLAVTSSARKAEFLSTLGTEVIVTERDQDFSELVKQATGGEGVDVVIDNVGTPIFTSARRSLARGGRWVLVGQLSGEFVPFNPAQLFLRGISMLSALSTSREQLRDALALVERGAVVPIVTEEFELEDVARAHAVLEAGESLGRVVVLPPALTGVLSADHLEDAEGTRHHRSVDHHPPECGRCSSGRTVGLDDRVGPGDLLARRGESAGHDLDLPRMDAELSRESEVLRQTGRREDRIVVIDVGRRRIHRRCDARGARAQDELRTHAVEHSIVCRAANIEGEVHCAECEPCHAPHAGQGAAFDHTSSRFDQWEQSHAQRQLLPHVPDRRGTVGLRDHHAGKSVAGSAGQVEQLPELGIEGRRADRVQPHHGAQW